MISINSSNTKGQRSKKEQRGYKTEKNALTRFDGCDIILQWYFEVWLSLVERCVRDAEAVGSSPVTSTSHSPWRALSVMAFLLSELNAAGGVFVLPKKVELCFEEPKSVTLFLYAPHSKSALWLALRHFIDSIFPQPLRNLQHKFLILLRKPRYAVHDLLCEDRIFAAIVEKMLMIKI